MHSKNKLTEIDHLERALSGQQYTCSLVCNEFNTDKSNNILSKVCVRENLSFVMDMELTYFSAGIFPDACTHCGTKQTIFLGLNAFLCTFPLLFVINT